MTKYIGMLLTAVVLIPGLSVSAEVAVRPESGGFDNQKVFSFIVSSDQSDATQMIKVEVPGELNNVKPLVKDRWNTNINYDDDNNVSEIIWQSGSVIPRGQAEEFQLLGDLDGSIDSLSWNIEQKYLTGRVISYGFDSSETDNLPAIITNLDEASSNSSTNQFPFFLALASLGVGLFALYYAYSLKQSIGSEMSTQFASKSPAPEAKPTPKKTVKKAPTKEKSKPTKTTKKATKKSPKK